jgi:hypothetical protein
MQTQRVQGQIGAQALPPGHPTTNQLETIFGGHTFFVGPRGLHVVEPAPIADVPEHTAALVKIGVWDDEERTKIVPQGAVLDGAVELGAANEDDEPAA